MTTSMIAAVVVAIVVSVLTVALGLYGCVSGWIETANGTEMKGRVPRESSGAEVADQMIADGREKAHTGIRVIVAGPMIGLGVIVVPLCWEFLGLALDLPPEVLP
jgi:hypothetical protein